MTDFHKATITLGLLFMGAGANEWLAGRVLRGLVFIIGMLGRG